MRMTMRLHGGLPPAKTFAGAGGLAALLCSWCFATELVPESGAPALEQPGHVPATAAPVAARSDRASAQEQTAPVAAAPQDLLQRLAGIRSLRGAFRQVLHSPEGEALEESRGRFSLLQPASILWRIDYPDRQRLIVDGETLWHYDEDLAAATRRPFDPTHPASPLAVLGGDGAALSAHYGIAPLGPEAWELQPRFKSPDFLAIRIYFAGPVPARMEVFDPLERRADIHFQQVELNPGINAAEFQFTPPPGVDVFDGG